MTKELKSPCECAPLKARAEWAEERLRHVAATLRIPDGARYLNDVREHADVEARTRAERDAYREALRRIAHFPFDVGHSPERDVQEMKEIAEGALRRA